MAQHHAPRAVLFTRFAVALALSGAFVLVTASSASAAPVVTTSGTTTDYVPGSSAVTVDPNVTVADSNPLASATVTISSGFQSGDVLTFTNTGDISASYDTANGVMSFSSPGSATNAQWASALSSVTFSSSSSTYGNRTISFVVNDGTGNSAPATDIVDVLDPLVVTTDSGSASFIAGDNTTSTPVTVDPGVTVSDTSSPTLASATVAITGNFQSTEDVPTFTSNSSTGNITGSYSTASGVLTLTSSGDTATIAQWTNALDTVTYTDTAITPNDATRTISFTVTDDSSATSNSATRLVTVTDVDQTPVVTTSGTTTSYASGSSAFQVDAHVTVSDRDNTTLASGTVSISSGLQSGDALSFSNSSATLFANITGSYNSSTGVMTLSSTGLIATDAQWANALSSVTFSSSSSTSGDRTISFVVNDGTENSAPATDVVDVTYVATPTPPLFSPQAALAITTTGAPFNGTAFALTLATSGGSGTGAVTYTVTSGTASGCSVSGATLTSNSAGSCVVTATKASSAEYLPISSPATTVTFSLATQSPLTIERTKGTVGRALTLSTRGGSGNGAVTYQVTSAGSANCSLSGATLAATVPGTCRINVTKAANGDYQSATSVATTVTFALPARPEPLTIDFSSRSTALAASSRVALTGLARHLLAGASLTITAHGPLGRQRAAEIESSLKKSVALHVQLVITTRGSATTAVVKTISQ